MYFTYFFLAFFVSCLASFGVTMAMRFFGIVDRPRTDERKIHRRGIPLGGGLAIAIGFFIVLTILFLDGRIGNEVTAQLLLGLLVGTAILMIGGILDDRYRLSPAKQVFFLVAAAASMIIAGLDFHTVTSPFGGTISLSSWTVPLGSFGSWIVLADVVVFCWLSGMMVTTKLLDGLDGLVTGIVCIGALLLFFISVRPPALHYEVALVSLVFAGACLGFLVWNFHPAKIFLGQGGSMFTGFVLGTLAILSQGKIATTLLVMCIPILDVIRVIIRRMLRRQPIFLGDREHLHFRLLASGLSQRQAVILLYAISFLFGAITLFLQNEQLLVAGFFLFTLLLLLAMRFSRPAE